jgi:hypothetical protein
LFSSFIAKIREERKRQEEIERKRAQQEEAERRRREKEEEAARAEEGIPLIVYLSLSLPPLLVCLQLN